MPRASCTSRLRALAALVAPLAAAAACERPEPAEPAPEARPAAAPAAGEPWNVLLITIDTLRADALGAYGQPRDTSPNLDRLASQGVVFEYCTTSAPSTLPSHASILTGKHPFAHGARANAGYVLPEENVTLAEVLRDAGWSTAAEIAAPVINARTQLDQGFESYRDISSFDVQLKTVGRVADEEVHLELPERAAPDITRHGLAFLSKHRDQKFFLWLHYFDPHSYYAPPQEFYNKHPDSPYHAEVAYADSQIGVVLKALDRMNLADRTLVIVTADHGEGLGDHGEDTHSYFVYDATVHVPLIVRGPGIAGGRRVQRLVRTIDIAPTVLDLLGLPPLPDVQGRSLRRLLDGVPGMPSLLSYGESIELYSTFGGDILRFVREGRFKYIHKPEPELYDVVADPREQHNLVEREPGTVARLREHLRDLVAGSSERPTGAEVTLDEATLDQLGALGYMGAASAPAIDDELSTLELDGPDANEMLADVRRMARAWGFVKGQQYARALEIFENLIERYPESLPAYRGEITALRKSERVDELVPWLERALQLDPENADYRRMLADVREKSGEIDAAERSLRAAVELEPCTSLPRSQLARLLARRGRFEERLAVLREGIERCRGQDAFLNDYAYALATTPNASYRDGEEALRIARKIATGDGSANPAFLDTLAAAYAESGDFPRAVEISRRALELVQSREAPEEVLEIFQTHLAMLEAGTPIRE